VTALLRRRSAARADASDDAGSATAPPEPVRDKVEAHAAAAPATVAVDGSVRQVRPTRPTNIRTAALCIIAVLLTLFALRTGAAFFIPLLLSLFLNYALAPVVTRLSRLGLPRPVGAALAVALVVAVLAGAFYRVSNDAATVLEQLPSAVQRLRLALTENQRQHSGALEHVKQAAKELEKLAAAAAPVAASPIAPASSPEKPIDMRSVLLVGTSSTFIALGLLMSALFLTFFLLAAGDLFRRKIISAVGPSLSMQKTTLRILDDIDRLNQHYFAVVVLINVAVGTFTALGLYAIGMEQPVVWGIATAILHTIPYLGSAVIGGAVALTAYGQFGTAQMALAASGIPILAAGVLGIGLQTWLMGRAARMNAPAIFVSLLFWGMVWGGWGLLLAVPVMVAIKTVCDNVDRLKPIGAILGP
jgi:predicted PurR-regulated permease PerM